MYNGLARGKTQKSHRNNKINFLNYTPCKMGLKIFSFVFFYQWTDFFRIPTQTGRQFESSNVLAIVPRRLFIPALQ